MPGQAIQVGPFIGGLNTFSDPSAIADNELVVCENFELDLDGSLKSRPPFVDTGADFSLSSSGNMRLLGYYYDAAGQPYLIASDGDSSTYSYSGVAWGLVTNALSAAAFVQFDDKAWLTAEVGSSQTGGYWTPTGGFAADANMPEGNIITVFKSRMWVAEGQNSTNNGTRLYRSQTLADPTLWESTNDFIDIGSGDGQNIVNIALYFNTLLIFRSGSIYGLQYATDPASAVVALVVPNVGLASRDAIDQFESFIYFMYEDKAYEFSNNRAQQINVKVPFESDQPSNIYLPFAVSEFNRRVIFSYYDKMYVYGLRTRTWTIWKSETFGAIGKIIKENNPTGASKAIAHKSVEVAAGASRSTPTLEITDDVSTASENMTCVMQTKNFNYQAGSVYKRLFWWGVDASFKEDVSGLAYPITFNFTSKWVDLLPFTWGSRSTFTWIRPRSEAPFVETDINVSDSLFSRKFIKFFKSLRFRQIFYRVEFPTDGSTTTAPVKLFSLMTYVNPKETVSRSVS